MIIQTHTDRERERQTHTQTHKPGTHKRTDPYTQTQIERNPIEKFKQRVQPLFVLEFLFPAYFTLFVNEVDVEENTSQMDEVSQQKNINGGVEPFRPTRFFLYKKHFYKKHRPILPKSLRNI